MTVEKRNQSFKLSDGRILGFAEYGVEKGIPILHFHGSGGSRLEFPNDISILNKLGIRLISVDRPGHGLSDYYENRTILDFAEDIKELTAFIKIDKYYVQGWSAGGPYALACAYLLHENVIATSLVSGVAPPNRPSPYKGLPIINKIILFIIRMFPRLMFTMRKGMSNALKLDDKLLALKLYNSLVPQDKKVFDDNDYMKQFIDDIREGYKRGYLGPALDDIITMNKKWGFSISEINTKVVIWQGKKDMNVPLNHGVYQSSVLPNNSLNILENEAHLYLYKMWDKILEKLITN